MFGSACINGFFGGGGTGGGGGGGNVNCYEFTCISAGDSFTTPLINGKTLFGFLTDDQGYNSSSFSKPTGSSVCTRIDGGGFYVGQKLLLFVSVS